MSKNFNGSIEWFSMKEINEQKAFVKNVAKHDGSQ